MDDGKEMRSLLRDYVEQHIHPSPSLNDAAYYPRATIVHNHMYRARLKLGLPIRKVRFM